MKVKSKRMFMRRSHRKLSVSISAFPASTVVTSAFPDWIIEYCTLDAITLDIGAGKDSNHIDASIQSHVLRLVGIDSSEDISLNLSVHEQYHISLEDFAKKTQEKFDILFCTMVLEHITDPDTFFLACRQLLKPGGMFFAVTPNLWHYFGLATKITSILKINEWLLNRLIGKQAKEAYHFPTIYKVNSLRAIRSILAHTGFHEVEFRCFDNWMAYHYVLQKQVYWVPRLYSRLMYLFNLPQLMGSIMFRATVL